ncbi:hypothetical protein [Segetibacter aerophilus]|uniref:Uncharacterized protein n=1 Tax=Segetibacter aerophilus TaxID=670293 RepID=A0A512BHG9_9BACT|nr:hypothetical protein [Segetibacter aerophilus]GEO11419.1 hypothetical protein SAE01_39150 [Segetibacter aerophilus]
MPLSNDNQDYGQSDEKNKQNDPGKQDENKLTTDDLKGKKVDREPGMEQDEPTEQKK